VASVRLHRRAARRARPPGQQLGQVAASKSTILSSIASRSLADTAWRTASGPYGVAAALGPPRCANAAASLVTLRARVESIPPCMLIGVAAPMLVPGDMAATSPAITTNTPAEAARAPPGVTQVITGTVAANSALTMSRMLVSSPPGVSTSSTSARYPPRSARSTACRSARALTGDTGPSSRVTSTRSLDAARDRAAAAAPAPKRPAHRTKRPA
jgi:hypothetical protein